MQRLPAVLGNGHVKALARFQRSVNQVSKAPEAALGSRGP